MFANVFRSEHKANGKKLEIVCKRSPCSLNLKRTSGR
uniref:Uncharacterized protein n=1 Tax=Anguilla anguilla TaxID=7936 RepID=A0A0E9V218_ANGAN